MPLSEHGSVSLLLPLDLSSFVPIERRKWKQTTWQRLISAYKGLVYNLTAQQEYHTDGITLVLLVQRRKNAAAPSPATQHHRAVVSCRGPGAGPHCALQTAPIKAWAKGEHREEETGNPDAKRKQKDRNTPFGYCLKYVYPSCQLSLASA